MVLIGSKNQVIFLHKNAYRSNSPCKQAIHELILTILKTYKMVKVVMISYELFKFLQNSLKRSNSSQKCLKLALGYLTNNFKKIASLRSYCTSYHFQSERQPDSIHGPVCPFHSSLATLQLGNSPSTSFSRLSSYLRLTSYLRLS